VEVIASTALKAGTKASISAASGDFDSDGGAILKGKLVLSGLVEGYVNDHEVYLETDDAGAFFLKLKMPV
jgi:hypothetical protein